MINESKHRSLQSYLIDQAKKINITLDGDKAKAIDSELNQVVDESRKFTDWYKKNSTQAELKIRLRPILEKYDLPILDLVFDEILRRAGNTSTPKSYWFVGASYGKGSEDQTERFITEGVWQNGYQDKRDELITFVTQLAGRFDLSYIKDKQLEDIDPFTVMGLFNRGITDDNRKAIAKELADFLDVDESVPDSFEGIPILNNQKSWF
ncbi:type I restriction enzyme endonuclease domain-containing protein [Bathymodiolus platifrons methanotrophic gill symbiont]|uniref:type I restriction enzyme endonuclease domain-containing protein n=1 Tax=Bathymodiolus platifrons methanotrophic gill symbiont TaxID=113268 RepID=UPI001C8CF6D1